MLNFSVRKSFPHFLCRLRELIIICEIGYMFGFLITVTLSSKYWRLLYWRYIIALTFSGMAATLLNTCETSLWIPQKHVRSFRTSVVFSECFWFINEITVILISYMRVKVVILSGHRVRYAYWTMCLVCPTLFFLRSYVSYTRFERVQSWDEVIAVNHLPYTFALAFVDLAYAMLFGYLIFRHFKSNSEIDVANGTVARKLKVSTSTRLLIVNMTMVLTAIAGFWQYTTIGAFILNVTACFKFNFGTFFCIDMIFMRTR